MDYVIQAFYGLQLETLAPGAYDCANKTKFTQIDFMRMRTRVQIEPEFELLFFNVTATISANLPDAIYKCYNMPNASLSGWQVHY